MFSALLGLIKTKLLLLLLQAFINPTWLSFKYAL